LASVSPSNGGRLDYQRWLAKPSEIKVALVAAFETLETAVDQLGLIRNRFSGGTDTHLLWPIDKKWIFAKNAAAHKPHV
jgi:hypothetical protein